jgi:hypothetical protein
LKSVVHVNSLERIHLAAGMRAPLQPIVTIGMKTNRREIIVTYSLPIEHK